MNSLLKLDSGTLSLKADSSFRRCIEISQQYLFGANESIVDKIFEVADDLSKINNFPVIKFLNSLTPSGMPVHCLKLKIGAVIMLLRNFNLKAGLCNGTRLMVRALQNNYIDGQVLTCVSFGKRVFVPRVQLTQSNSNLLFTLKRRQFYVYENDSLLSYYLTKSKIFDEKDTLTINS
ncbi:uncharacterized protein LOC105849379 [Hydra vulgaris]|uniref:uncharacterized protein LOC105849379 n=1 Tax=Hydra vulgaris TaxID=6087 RepID=UPI001F5F40F4|nr:uncharacterized protein LOC105849379 [Hydra vulgaris]